MTRDGAVSVNLVTGETTYPSDRTPEQDHSASGDTAGAAGKVVDRVELHREQAAAKKKRRKQRRTYREGEAAAGRPSSDCSFRWRTRPSRSCKGPSASRTRRRTGWTRQRPLFHPNCHPQHANPLSRPIQEQAQPSTARSERWSRKIPASSRATWGNVALRRLWATETAVSRTGGRNAS